MKTLMILRHAKATHNLPVADFDRPLRGRGQRDADALGRDLVNRGLLPDYIVCSAATRARQTVELLLAAGGQSIEVDYRRDIYLAPPPEYARALQETPNEKSRAMIVGHNPSIEEWVADLGGHRESIPPGTLVVFRLAIDDWRELTLRTEGELLEVLRPKERNEASDK